MKIIDTKIAGLHIVETTPFTDARGSFSRWFCARELAPVLEGRSIAQINHSKTLKKGCVRGLHFQRPPHGEIKLVRCISGRVWDVALDLRAGSKTFLQWFGVELVAGDGRMLAVPERFAHGFQALEPGSEVMYLNTGFYEPAAEGAVNYADPLIAIKWPLPPVDLSERDAAQPFLGENFQGLKL